MKMEVLELLKTLIEKLKVTYILIACLVTAFIAKFVTADKIWLVISFCSTYLLVEFIVWLHSKYLSYSQKHKEEMEEEENNKTEENNEKELIWQHFISLSDRTLEVAKEIYYANRPDINNPLLRLLPKGSCPSYLVYASFESPFDIQLDNRSYIPCISGEHKDNNVLITFNSYFYSLLEIYVKTGNKTKLKLQ